MDSGIPSCCPANDLEGRQAWLDVLCEAQARSEIKCLVYDDDSPNGDPFQAGAVRDAASSLSRSVVALDALLLSPACEPSFTREQLGGRTPHCLKGVLSTVARCALEKKEVQNEIGKWDGSSAQQFIDPLAEGSTRLNAEGEPEYNILEHYTSVGAEEAHVPAIMERQVARMRAHVLDVGAQGLPAVGGFAYYAPPA